MQVAQGLTSHTIVLVVEKRERGIASQALLAKMGYRVLVAVGLYDSLKVIEQEMPHMVVCEVTLTDGTCVHLFDKLQQNKLLSKTPILAYSVKKAPEEINLIRSRKFSGAYAGALDPKTFVQTISALIARQSPISPFYFGALQCGLAEDLTLRVESTVIGRIGDQLLMRGVNDIDQNASMLCVPKSPEMSPAVLRMASNMKNGEDIYNLFPISRAIGKGKIWMDKLPNIDLQSLGKSSGPGAESPSSVGSPRRVIFYDPNEARAEQFRQILSGYDIEVIYAKSLTIAAQLLAKGPETVGGVYLYEILNDATSTEWKNTYSKLSATARPPVICGTTAAGTKNTDSTRYIKRPFGMGILVEMMEATFTRGSKLAAVVGTASAPANASFLVSMQAPAKLVGLDETGGVLQLKFPVAKGSKVEIVHEFVQALVGGNSVTIVAAASLPSQPDVFQARFESIGAGQSKAKY
ncbi:MAG: hypothetical protein NTV34_15725 [Proteobacteria bacterium]|nr:hypothetical protein [Pseudomonadota bacterium]